MAKDRSKRANDNSDETIGRPTAVIVTGTGTAKLRRLDIGLGEGLPDASLPAHERTKRMVARLRKYLDFAERYGRHRGVVESLERLVKATVMALPDPNNDVTRRDFLVDVLRSNARTLGDRRRAYRGRARDEQVQRERARMERRFVEEAADGLIERLANRYPKLGHYRTELVNVLDAMSRRVRPKDDSEVVKRPVEELLTLLRKLGLAASSDSALRMGRKRRR